MALKVTNWNIEHAGRLLVPNPTADVLDRRVRVRNTIEEINPDILCIQEGPAGEQGIADLSAQVLNGQWLPVLIAPGNPLGTHDDDYQTAGTQWVWFLVRPALQPTCRLQPPSVWQAFTGSKTWPVNLWGQQQVKRHDHYRHPQLMIHTLPGGLEVEFAGVHLKSKINKRAITRDAEGNLTGAYLDEALEARIKLATEARNVREYIAAKFAQVSKPAIVVMGDCNDGPGHDFFETRYLFFDLISNIQGDVLVAERFFNHALFDFPGHLRWTAKYRDEVLNIPASQNPLLLDHILLSQPLTRGELPIEARPGAGGVEHEAYERHNAGASSKRRTSDHRPVSCTLS